MEYITVEETKSIFRKKREKKNIFPWTFTSLIHCYWPRRLEFTKKKNAITHATFLFTWQTLFGNEQLVWVHVYLVSRPRRINTRGIQIACLYSSWHAVSMILAVRISGWEEGGISRFARNCKNVVGEQVKMAHTGFRPRVTKTTCTRGPRALGKKSLGSLRDRSARKLIFALDIREATLKRWVFLTRAVLLARAILRAK